MIDMTVNKDLQRIPLDYFNQTVDSVWFEYSSLLQSHRDLVNRKKKIDLGERENMIISKRMAIDAAISKKKKNCGDKLVVLNGFMSVTANMCEDRLKGIIYQIKNHPEEIDAEEMALLEQEQNGIFDYLAKIEQIKSCIPEDEEESESEQESK